MKQSAALVVGSSGGIGNAITRKLKAIGYKVIGMDKMEPETEILLDDFINVDLADENQTRHACTLVRNHVKELWGLVYAAGVYHPAVAFDNYDVDLWKQVHAVNVTGAFIIVQELLPLVIPGGRIITVVSGAAHVGSRDLAYSASKASLLGLTKSLALNLAARGILVNAICPGPIDTPMANQMPSDRVLQYKERMLLHRFGKPEEVAAGVAFLMSPENSFMTGATLDVNGGLYLR